MFDAVECCRPIPTHSAAVLVAAALCVVVHHSSGGHHLPVLNHADRGSITDHDPDKVDTEGYILRVDTQVRAQHL